MNKNEKTERTVARTMEAAMTEFGTNGYAGGTVNNICKAGINKGLIYHNFSGKDELFLACLRYSCQKLTEYIDANGGAADLKRYMAVRMDFFHTFPREAHIIFEALLNPPLHLSDAVNEALAGFNGLNETICKKTLDALVLRKGVTMEEALSYFHLMQIVLNGYFSSPAFQNVVFYEKVKIHEKAIAELFDYMLYGVAEGERK